MKLRISLLVLAFSTLVVFSAAAPAVQDIVPEETLNQQNMHQNLKLPIMEFLQGTQHARSDAEVISLLATKMKQEPESIKALNDAIEKIIQDMTNSHKATQKLINDEVDSYKTCAEMPLVDKTANDNAANKFLLIDPAQKEQDAAANGNIDFDFGKNPAQSDIAAGGVKTAVDTYKKVFDDTYNRRKNAQSTYDSAQTASDNADVAKTKANHQCYCAAKKVYDDVSKSAKTSSANDKANLKHFQMIQCVMAEFAKEKKATDAFTLCKDKNYDDKIVTIDFKADNFKLDDSVKCGGGGGVPSTGTGDPRTGKYVFFGLGYCGDGAKKPFSARKKLPYLYSNGAEAIKTTKECATKGLTLKGAIGFSITSRSTPKESNPQKGTCYIFFPAGPIRSNCDGGEEVAKDGEEAAWVCNDDKQNNPGMKIAYASGYPKSTCNKFEMKEK